MFHPVLSAKLCLARNFAHRSFLEHLSRQSDTTSQEFAPKSLDWNKEREQK